MKKLTIEEFIKKANKVHNNRYDYSKSVYINSGTKLSINCANHGNFLQTPEVHLDGCGCPNCSRTKKLTTEEFIKKSKEIHGDRYDYSMSVYKNMKTKLIIICSIHGKFSQKPEIHFQKCGCMKCSGKEKLTIEEFIKKANKIHNNRYDYSKSIYIGIFEKLIIICKKHGEFLQSPSHHLGGHGCAKCGGSKRLTTEEFIKRANKIHNNKYDYSKSIYVNSGTKLIIICEKHGKFLQRPNDHLNGQGCSACSGIRKLTTEEFIKRANEVHNNRYNYSKSIYRGSGTKLSITCITHGDFLQTPYQHWSGAGCSECAGVKKSTIEEFIEKANKVHNNKYDYSESIYTNTDTNLFIICKKHGKFSQTPRRHLGGSQCTRCSKSVSKISQRWLNLLKVKEREYTIIINGKKFVVDGYDPITNTAYEFYGDYWHGNPAIYDWNDYNKRAKKKFRELYLKTIQKEIEIRNAGFKLITIWESEFKNAKM